MLPLGDGELVDGQPIVVVGRVEIDNPRLRPRDRTVRAAVLDRHPIDQHPVYGTVALQQRRRVAARELAKCIFQRFMRELRVQTHQRLPQSSFQHHIPVVRVAALGSRFAGRDVRAVQHRVAERLEPGEGCFLDR